MIIACPRCETTFSLPDELYKPGKKARCSNCGFVFAMPDTPGGTTQAPTSTVIGESAQPVASAPKQEPPVASKSRKLRIASIIVTVPLVLLLFYGAYLIVSAYLFTPENPDDPSTSGKTASQSANGTMSAKEALVNSIALDEIRQFLIENMEIGKVMVIQGFAVNNSDKNKSLIAIEARVLDENNNVLAKEKQLCGVPLTLYQLQQMSEKSLKDSLTNRTTILVNNTNVPSGGRVPFVVIFPNPPESMRTFEVRVVDVEDASENSPETPS